MIRGRALGLGATLIALALLTGALAVSAGVSSTERELLELCHGWLDGWSGSLFVGASQAGFVQVLMPVSLVFAVSFGIGLRTIGPALAPLVAAGIASGTNPALKQLFDRERPNLEPQHALASLSMPSGHAATSMACALSLTLVLRGVRGWSVAAGVLMVFTAVVGVSRMVLGVHWPTDVIAGWAYGAGVAVIVVGLLDRRRLVGTAVAAMWANDPRAPVPPR